ncbi:MAG: universal stress protein, partial [Pseudonocardia sp.]|nr:universal stress protein [Pseudonocardia sp.]
LPADPSGVAPPVDGFLTTRAWAEPLLRDAVARARSVASDVEVAARLRPGTPARVLLDEGEDAQLLVVGSGGRCGLRGLLRRSVAVGVTAHASCPVVVLRPPQVAFDAGWWPPRVVVGVDGSESCLPAVAFALRAACRRGIPLVAVHAWTPDLPADLEAVCGPPEMAEASARRTLDRVLARLPLHPPARGPAGGGRGDPAHALVDQSRGAALLVVGARGRGRVLGTVLGSVSQAVLRDGRCPLAVIRHVGAPTARSAAEADRDQSRGELL